MASTSGPANLNPATRASSRRAAKALGQHRSAQSRLIDVVKIEDHDDSNLGELTETSDRSMQHQVSELEQQHQVTLCDEQHKLLSLAYRGENIWITGAAGTGKSTVIKFAIQLLRSRGLRVRVVAPTGIAALNVNGTTTWVYAGWKPEHQKMGISELKRKLRYADENSFPGRRIRNTDVLIIDEISMVSNDHLERLSQVMAAAMGKNLAFGGAQVIVTGDFCQLPPVKPFQNCMDCGKEMWIIKPQTLYRCPEHGEREDRDKWAFCAPAWEKAQFIGVNLTENHRQDDSEFVGMLDRIRFGKPLSGRQLVKLGTCGANCHNPTKLFSRRADAHEENVKRLAELSKEVRSYHCLDEFQHNPEHRHLRFKGSRSKDGTMLALAEHRYEPALELKKDAQVVLLTNLDINSGLVNGSKGRIAGFERNNYATYPRPSFRDDFATQGIDDTREKTALDPLAVLEGDHRTYQYEQQKGFILEQPFEEWPVVLFDNGLRVTVRAHCSIQELGDEKPYSLLSRTQIPLSLAYGLTIHKSQGMTLSAVEVDLSRTWETGQDYVAMSRTRTLDRLKVRGFGNAGFGSAGFGDGSFGIAGFGNDTLGGSMNERVREFYTQMFPDLRPMLEDD